MRKILLFVAPMLLAPTCVDDSDEGKITDEGDSGLSEPSDGPGGDADGDGTFDDDDCAPDDPAIHPEADEVCDGVDNNCDGVVDDAWSVDAATWYADRDGDGYGDPDVANVSCLELSGWVADDSDCDDSRADAYPGADEPDDGVDHDCDGVVDDGGVDDDDVDVEAAVYEGIEVTIDDPGYPTHAYQVPVEGDTALRLFGVYEPGRGDGEAVDLVYDVDESVVLVLMSYDPTTWRVTETHAGAIQAIYTVFAVDGSSVEAPSGVAVTDIDSHNRSYDWDDPRIRSLEQTLLGLTGLRVASMYGSYSPYSIVVTEGEFTLDPAYPQCDDYTPSTGSTGPDFSVIDPSCESVMEESTWCLAAGGYDGLRLIGLDSGDSCDLGLGLSATAPYFSPLSMVWQDEYVYGCDGDYDMLQRVSLVDGSLEKSYIYCEGVVARAGGLLVFPSYDSPDLSEWSSYAFNGFEDAQCGTFADELDTNPSHASRFTSHDDRLYGVWHSTDTVHSWDLDDLTAREDLRFEDYNSWVQGLSVTDDGVLAISSYSDGIMTFDAATGEHLDTTSVEVYSYGLECFSGR